MKAMSQSAVFHWATKAKEYLETDKMYQTKPRETSVKVGQGERG